MFVSVTQYYVQWSYTLYRAFSTDIGADVMSPGLVQDGTKCDNDRVCLTQECVPVTDITTLACEAASNGLICSGNGVRYWNNCLLILLRR